MKAALQVRATRRGDDAEHTIIIYITTQQLVHGEPGPAGAQLCPTNN